MMDEEKAAAATALILQLLALDAKATAAGHSLIEILVVAARNQFGIDVRPDPVEAGAEVAEAAGE